MVLYITPSYLCRPLPVEKGMDQQTVGMRLQAVHVFMFMCVYTCTHIYVKACCILGRPWAQKVPLSVDTRSCRDSTRTALYMYIYIICLHVHTLHAYFQDVDTAGHEARCEQHGQEAMQRPHTSIIVNMCKRCHVFVIYGCRNGILQ